MNVRYRVDLSQTERDELSALVSGGKQPVRRLKRMQIPKANAAEALRLPRGKRLFDTPAFPAEWKEPAAAGIAFLEELRQEADVDWTFFSPAAFIFEGPRTFAFRIGGERIDKTPPGMGHASKVCRACQGAPGGVSVAHQYAAVIAKEGLRISTTSPIIARPRSAPAT